MYRHLLHGLRQQRLILARAMLEKHFEGLERLDNDETPEEALDLAFRFSHLIQDPRTPDAILSVLAGDPNSFRPTRSVDSEMVK